MQKRSLGFTLLETMVVTAITATVIIAVPALLLSMRQQGAGHAVNQLRADLQRARLQAIKERQACTIEFNLPAANQYSNAVSRQISDLKTYKGGVHFLPKGPDGIAMTGKVAFNRRGMSTTIAPKNIYVSDETRTRIYRVRILPPGGILVHHWDGNTWR